MTDPIDEAKADGLAAIQAHLAQDNTLSAPIVGGLATFHAEYPKVPVGMVVQDMRRVGPNAILAAVAYGYFAEGKGSPEECVAHVLAGGDDVCKRVADLISQEFWK
jgi:hypothetical protein